MNLRQALIAAAALAIAASAHAHDCSGGNDGGMDATGNQCNEPGSVVAAATVARSAAPAELPTAVLLEAGLAAYDRGHDMQAIAYFRRAAEGGDARSAEILALMYRFGPRLFRVGVVADPAESARWAAAAADARRREAAAAIAAR